MSISLVSWGSASLLLITIVSASLSPTPVINQSVKIDSRNSIKNANVKAFLDVIAFAEGTSGPDGYRMMYTGKKFDSFSKHPDINNCAIYDGKNLCSTAAGRYQILITTYTPLAQKLGLSDFSPESQNLAAIELLKQIGAYDDVVAGKFDSAVYRSARTWASLPTRNGGSFYGQPSREIDELRNEFKKAGGKVN